MQNNEFGDENYFDGYNKSIESLKDKPETVQIDKLLYAVFETPNGKALMSELERRYVIPGLASRSSANYSEELIYCEGFKEAFRFMKTCITSHKQRIAVETESND